MISDEDLLDQILDYGEREGLWSLMRQYKDFAYSLALRLLYDSKKSEIAVRNTFIQLINSLPSLRNYPSIKVFIAGQVFSIAQSERRELRQRKVRGEKIAALPKGMDIFESAKELEKNTVEAYVSELTSAYRLPIILHYFCGLSTEETGHILNVESKVLFNRLSKGVDKLQTRYDRFIPGVNKPQK